MAQFKTHHLLFTAFLLSAITGSVVGCGSDKATVHGKVMRKDGTPLVGARVILQSTETTTPPKSARGVTDTNGHYELGTMNKGDGVPPGSYHVVVVEERRSALEVEDVSPRAIAAKYERLGESGLALEVKPGEEKVFDMVLDAK